MPYIRPTLPSLKDSFDGQQFCNPLKKIMTTNHPAPDIFADIELYPTSKGGRASSIAGEYFGCPAKIGEELFECRIYLEGQAIAPGTTKQHLPIKFMSPDLVKPLLKEGDRFLLWESKIFGEAIVAEIRF